MSRSFARVRGASAALGTLLAAVSAQAELPPENQCPTLSGLPGAGVAEDATPTRLREGMQLAFDDILLLGSLLPPEVWRNREQFFHDGMRLEVGACHRRYPVADHYRQATERFAKDSRLDREGNLTGNVAGLPFPPDEIDPKARDAGIKWAWNTERRYRGAGHSGKFRLVDMASRVGGPQTYEGDWFFLLTRRRADLVATDYAVPIASEEDWVAGGTFAEPTSARHLAWRQIRSPETTEHYSKPDDTFVYVPTMRKVRRAASAWVDGLYMPRYRVAGDVGGGGMPVGGGEGYGLGSINPTAGESIQVTENLRRGFTGLVLRPNAYDWRVMGEREVLAPINVTRTGWPEDKNRNFGPSGLSIGSDRWDVRWVVVLQGQLKERGREYDLLTLWVDYQTQQPLYALTRRRFGGPQVLEVGILGYRYSGDVARYPTWPGVAEPRVFDPVVQVFFDSADGGSGWRRESYDLKSVPPEEGELRRLTSPGFLERGH